MSQTRQDDQTAAGRPGLSLTIADPGGLLSIAAAETLRLLARRAVERLDRAGEVRVKLVADAEMAAAHLKFSKVEGTTDVLTFDLAESEKFDVDILACVDEARRQGAVHGHETERELLLYILHGALHCMGYDDHDDESFARMHAMEDRILEEIGVGPTFARGKGESR